jgi:hypothetical protein
MGFEVGTMVRTKPSGATLYEGRGYPVFSLVEPKGDELCRIQPEVVGFVTGRVRRRAVLVGDPRFDQHRLTGGHRMTLEGDSLYYSFYYTIMGVTLPMSSITVLYGATR